MSELNPEIQNMLDVFTTHLMPIIVAETMIPTSDKFIELNRDFGAWLQGPVNDYLTNEHCEEMNDIAQHFYDNMMFMEVTKGAGWPIFFMHAEEVLNNCDAYKLEFPAMANVFRAIIKYQTFQELKDRLDAMTSGG